jgi:signal transduction histidine kinase
MRERKRQIFLILIMTTVSLIVASITIGVLYNTAFEEARERLVETAQSQARLIEAVARFDASHEKAGPGSYTEGATAATLSQITDAHMHYKGFGQTGEFTLARREGDNIVFLLRHRHFDLDKPKPVALDSKLAEPMRRALSGLSGTVVGLDYRGVAVLAAYEPVSELDFGIVAKIDLTEIRAPFVRAGIIAMCAAFLVVLVGVFLFYRVSNPIIHDLRERTAELTVANEQLQREIVERKKAEKALTEAHAELETRVEKRTIELVRANERLRRSQEELRLLSSQLLTIHEDERRRIAGDLHDSICQSLNVIKLKIGENLGHLDNGMFERAEESCKKMATAIQDALDEVREICMDLRPAILDDLGILVTIDWFCRKFQELYPEIGIEKKLSVEERQVPESLKIVIYRLLQETMNNIAKHSKADRVLITVREEDNTLELAIEDNGLGFDLEEVLSVESTRRGLGLGTMRERTGLSGGSFSIETAKGAGTVVRASWQSQELESAKL